MTSAAKSFLLVFVAYTVSMTQSLDKDRWTTNGPVYASVYDTATGALYIGGAFSHVGPYTGGFAILDRTTGTKLETNWDVAGLVNAVVPDQSGGWYVGGWFSKVGGIERKNLAHILANGSLDQTWNPNINKPVQALAVIGDRLFVGGEFDTVDALPRGCAAGFDRTTGTLTSWDPQLIGVVYSLLGHGGKLYVGGSFSSTGGASRTNAAAYYVASGAIAPWAPPVSGGAVRAMTALDTTIYLGGQFTQLYTSTRNRLAATDTGSGVLRTWNPNSNNAIYSMTMIDTLVYVGGSFTQIGSTIVGSLGAISRTTGLVKSWYPYVVGTVRSLSIQGDTIHIGGNFSEAGYVPRLRYAAFRRSNHNTTIGLNLPIGGDVYAVSASGTSVAIGGWFNCVGGETRLFAAALDAATGALLPWAPKMNGSVQSIAVTDSLIFLGGTFTYSGDSVRSGIASFLKSDGSITSWNPYITSTLAKNIYSIIARGTTVFIGGQFDVIRGIARQNIAKLRTTSNFPADEWNLKPNSLVRRMMLIGSKLYFIGDFTGLLRYNSGLWDIMNRSRAAAVDTNLGYAAAWNPDPSAGSILESMALIDSTIYLGGNFGIIGGASRIGIAAVDTVTGRAVTSFDAQPFGTVRVMKPSGSILYVGGPFTSIGGESRNRLAALNARTGTATSWNPGLEGAYSVYAIESIPNRVVLGWDYGSAAYVGGQARPFAFLEPSGGGTAVENPDDHDGTIPVSSSLEQNYPNPFNPTTVVRYQVSVVSRVDLRLYDILGREVAVLVNEEKPAGMHAVMWNAQGMASGIYFCRLQAGGNIFTRKMVLMR